MQSSLNENLSLELELSLESSITLFPVTVYTCLKDWNLQLYLTNISNNNKGAKGEKELYQGNDYPDKGLFYIE